VRLPAGLARRFRKIGDAGFEMGANCWQNLREKRRGSWFAILGSVVLRVGLGELQGPESRVELPGTISGLRLSEVISALHY
jgi:hypothetical protein